SCRSGSCRSTSWTCRSRAPEPERASRGPERRRTMSSGLASKPREEHIPGASGLKLFVRSWRPDVAVRGVVAIVPGFNSHSGYYGWVGEQLAANGLAAYAVDLRGRGRSDGERFYVKRFADYVSDVETLIALLKSREPGVPVF